jgi:hypothetical protein
VTIGRTSRWDLETILDNLRSHLREQRPVTLYNTYEGVPITYEAEVAMIHSEYVGVVTHPFQTVCIKQERRTYIQTRGIPDLIRAYPVSVDYTNKVVMLDQLKIPHTIPNDLYHSWITPESEVHVEMDSDLGGTHQGELMMLASFEENAIRMVVEVPDELTYEWQDDVQLTFKLPESGDLVQVFGIVHSLTQLKDQDSQLMEVTGQAPMQDEIAILAYIARQEDRTMSELEKAYMKLRKGKSI